jgi:hypothetical protein
MPIKSLGVPCEGNRQRIAPSHSARTRTSRSRVISQWKEAHKKDSLGGRQSPDSWHGEINSSWPYGSGLPFDPTLASSANRTKKRSEKTFLVPGLLPVWRLLCFLPQSRALRVFVMRWLLWHCWPLHIVVAAESQGFPSILRRVLWLRQMAQSGRRSLLWHRRTRERHSTAAHRYQKYQGEMD